MTTAAHAGLAGDDAGRRGGEGTRWGAYSWRGLTSGGWTRALWLLLVPFMLVNVAVFMTPFPFRDGDDEDPERSRRRSAEAATRVLALALTGTLVLAACGIFMDLLAWQCGYSAGRCTSTPPLGILVVDGLRTPSQRLALGALAVLAVVGLLAWLGRSTWTVNERLEPRSEAPRRWWLPAPSAISPASPSSPTGAAAPALFTVLPGVLRSNVVGPARSAAPGWRGR